ncbi:MAG: tRNA 2-selenouridine(34) synthase MnmH [Pseudomonadota bacterium]|nr:tRNA 2-selenouridine(34) synthase MnmH [Pseudomonadota bacterium]
MSVQAVPAADALGRLDGYSAVIDARSEGEFALDRLPGAVNWPSLHDAERASIGSEDRQSSAFAARKRGAMLVARNIAAHLERHVLELPRDWRPLVYCWRGGQRSGALATVLGQIGFRVEVVEGGYQRYRRAVLEALEVLPATLDWRVVGGPTGAGKSRLLGELQAQGAQVLDLEALAEHRGSVLGNVPGSPQPTQKQFDTRLWNALRKLDPARPVFVESESRKIGELRLPPALLERMRAAPCIRLDADVAIRADLLLTDYPHFSDDVEAFCACLGALRAHCGGEQVDAWQQAARRGELKDVVEALLALHYDPAYTRSLSRNYPGMARPLAVLAIGHGGQDALAVAARQAITSAAPAAA